MTKKPTQMIAYSSILVAFGILIPMVMPVKIIIGPASYTLASHVPIFLACFLSLPIAIFVSLGTALGFFLAGFPFIIVMRALSQVIFATVAAAYLSKNRDLLKNPFKTVIFASIISLIHALAEFLVVLFLTKVGSMDSSYLWSLIGLVGFGTFVHSMIDFYLSLFLWKSLVTKIGLKLA